MNVTLKTCTVVLLAAFAVAASGQSTTHASASSGRAPIPSDINSPVNRPVAAGEPTSPAASTFSDTHYSVSFRVPTAWNLTRKDSEVSTFHFDARTAPKTAQMRAVANITFNPHPYSTFSGALFYFSVTPHVSVAECAQQAKSNSPHAVTTVPIEGVSYTHGYDEHGGICTESRDEIYTTQRQDTCFRFDMVINNFCGGDVSGVRDITAKELDSVRERMQVILNSVRFDAQ